MKQKFTAHMNITGVARITVYADTREEVREIIHGGLVDEEIKSHLDIEDIEIVLMTAYDSAAEQVTRFVKAVKEHDLATARDVIGKLQEIVDATEARGAAEVGDSP